MARGARSVRAPRMRRAVPLVEPSAGSLPPSAYNQRMETKAMTTINLNDPQARGRFIASLDALHVLHIVLGTAKITAWKTKPDPHDRPYHVRVQDCLTDYRVRYATADAA